ncbi:hypothetical protein CASFOL_035760 [Castilleja foliolosa]|uniref:NAC domain-containing protein n=1 Tax=Castilleja foliolosa TaxID=1961234 RepID=A0ABD3BTK8_9LAMI
MENNNHQQTGAGSSSAQKSSPYPPGYRFMPKDQELIDYLLKKVNKEPLPVSGMYEVNFYEQSPSQLAGEYPPLGDKDYYFFTSRYRKYPNGIRPDRGVKNIGFWKATGTDIIIRSDDGQKIGKKMVLVFYTGKPKPKLATKTDWIMHEYMLPDSSIAPDNTTKNMMLDDWVLCRIYLRPERLKKEEKSVDDVNDNGALIIHNNNVIDKQNQDDRGHEYQHIKPNSAIKPNLVGTSKDLIFDVQEFDLHFDFDDVFSLEACELGQEYDMDFSDDINTICLGFSDTIDYGSMILSNDHATSKVDDVRVGGVDDQQVDDASTRNVDGQQVGGVDGQQVDDASINEVDGQQDGRADDQQFHGAYTGKGKKIVDDQ